MVCVNRRLCHPMCFYNLWCIVRKYFRRFFTFLYVAFVYICMYEYQIRKHTVVWIVLKKYLMVLVERNDWNITMYNALFNNIIYIPTNRWSKVLSLQNIISAISLGVFQAQERTEGWAKKRIHKSLINDCIKKNWVNRK